MRRCFALGKASLKNTRVLIVPAYPQYSGTTTASVFDAVYRWGLKTRLIPELRFVNRYHDDPRYIAALAGVLRAPLSWF